MLADAFALVGMRSEERFGGGKNGGGATCLTVIVDFSSCKNIVSLERNMARKRMEFVLDGANVV